MQIGSISSSSSFSLERATASTSQADSSDQAQINTSPEAFSGLVQQASQMPEVRSELVDAYKSRVQSGHYPSAEVEAGLVQLIGGSIARAAHMGTSVQKN